MTVAELKQILRRMPATATVVIATDAAYTEYQPLESVEFGYWEVNEAFGEFHTKADIDDPNYNWHPTDETALAVCLIPEE